MPSQKWIPILRNNMRQNNKIEHGFVSIKTRRVLEHFFEEVDAGSSKENVVNQELRAADLIEADRQPL
jgi:hypothetical protein